MISCCDEHKILPCQQKLQKLFLSAAKHTWFDSPCFFLEFVSLFQAVIFNKPFSSKDLFLDALQDDIFTHIHIKYEKYMLDVIYMYV